MANPADTEHAPNSERDPKQHEGPSSPGIESLTKSVEPAIEEHKSQDKHEARRDRRRLLVEAATLFLLVVASVIGWWNLQALETSNTQNREAFEASQRAYVTVNGLDIQPVKNADGVVTNWRATPIFMNNGNTPTKNLWWTGLGGDTRGITFTAPSAEGKPIAITTRGPDGPMLQKFGDLKDATRNRMTLAPHQEERGFLGLSQVLPPNYIDGLVKHTARIYIHGYVFYEDMFSAKGHVTRYCYSLWHNAAVTGTEISFSQCGGASNCSDEECEDYQNLKKLVGPAPTGLSDRR